MSALVPKLHILPESQRQIWDRLGSTPKNFVLYGGTALALRLGHRASVDFDFFSCHAFRPDELLRTVAYLHNQSVTQQSENTLSCDVDTNKGPVKISFFGDLSLRQIEPPDRFADSGIAIASLRDLFGTKCATVPQRNEVKDYLDIHALVTQAKLDLAEGVACARAIYGRQYNPLMTLQALSYFDDLPNRLPSSVKADLLAAVKAVSVGHLPRIEASGKIGDAAVLP